MLRVVCVAAVCAAGLGAGQADAGTRRGHDIVRQLDQNGFMSAGWLDVLPTLAATCNLRLDNQLLTGKLIDLSHQDGNISYTRDLYQTLYLIKHHHAQNGFGRLWTTRFEGRQKDACDTAETLWGEKGRQFPGVLKRDASDDAPVGQPGTAPADCK